MSSEPLECVIRALATVTPIDIQKFPPIITRNTNAIEKPFEFQSVGQVMKSEDLKNLKTGKYLYIIDDQKNVWITSDVPQLDIDLGKAKVRNLATHRSLEGSMLATRPDAKVYAAGEIQIINGEVPSISNRSYTFMGGEEHLNWAAAVLKDEGLALKSGTQLEDYSAAAEGAGYRRHFDAREIAVQRIRAQSLPELKKFEALYAKLHQLLPDPSVPGIVDRRLLNSDIAMLALQSKKDNKITMDDFDEIYQGLFLIRDLYEYGHEATARKYCVGELTRSSPDEWIAMAEKATTFFRDRGLSK